MGSAATVTDSSGESVEIEDDFFTLYSIPGTTTEFDAQWRKTDDRVMGGKSYSEVELENGYAKFHGTASSDGGGFSNVRYNDEFSFDLSEYEGLVFDVASQDPRPFQFSIGDDTWRWPSS